jgi:hypothetical protein
MHVRYHLLGIISQLTLIGDKLYLLNQATVVPDDDLRDVLPYFRVS